MRSRRALIGLGALVALGGCGSQTDYVVVHVDARAAVQGARTIAVTLGNAGTKRTDNLALNGRDFPVTFSISAPGRTGELAVAIDALDDNQLVVGRGAATTTVDADSATVLLDSMDFVVNTDYAGDQFPSNDFEAAGFQLAALPDGTWTTVFRENCPASSTSCSLFARRFDRRGKPVATVAAAGTNAFVITGRPTTDMTTPAIASSPTATIAAWDYVDPGSATTSGVACRAINGTGALGADQVPITTETADVVSATALAGGNFVVTWKTILSSGLDAIRMATAAADCSLVGTVQTVASGPAVADLLHRGSVAAGANQVLFAWITNGDLHTRLASAAGVLSAPETTLVKQTATEQVEHARVVAVPGGGFAIAVRWTIKASSTGTSHIDLFRVSDAGALVGTPVLVTDQSGNDFDSRQSFGIASRSDATTTPPDDTVMVVWHSCGGLNDGSLCGVFGRLLRSGPMSDGFTAVGDRFAIPTTTAGDQKLPSVVGLPDAFVAVWADASATPPDTAGLAVRARIVYPPDPPGG